MTRAYVYGPNESHAAPVPVLKPEDEEFYYPSNFVEEECTSEDIPSPFTYTKRFKDLLEAGCFEGAASSPVLDNHDNTLAWSGGAINTEEFNYELSSAEILEIESALARFPVDQPTTLDNLSPKTFFLPTLGAKLKILCKTALEHKGIIVLRGLDPDRYNLLQNIILYVGLTSHISTERAVQNFQNDLLVHVRDSGILTGPNQYRRETFGYSAQPFHTDYAPIITMYVMDCSVQGGRCLWVSSMRVYQELASSRPDVLPVLEKPNWPFQKFVNGIREPGIEARPLLYFYEGKPFFFYSRRNLTGTPLSNRPTDIPELTPLQADALDALHFAALKHCARYAPRKGDVQIMNNLSVLHTREHFVDVRDHQERHLMRLWLKNPAIPHEKLPIQLQKIFEDVFSETRQKIARWELRGHNDWNALVDETTHTST
ncbi:hypothetical protein BDV12DRAFT_173750 [Aspergillus spectabilis]